MRELGKEDKMERKEEQRKRKAVLVLLSRIKRPDKGGIKGPKALSSKPMEKRRHAHREEMTIYA